MRVNGRLGGRRDAEKAVMNYSSEVEAGRNQLSADQSGGEDEK